VFVVPVFLTSNGGYINWHVVLLEWLRIWPYVLIFSLNNWLLFPYLEKKRYAHYFLLLSFSLFLTGLLSLLTPWFHSLIEPQKSFPVHNLFRFSPFLFFNTILISILVAGLNNAIRIGANSVREQQRIVALEKENISQQLALLKNQISPHFFMNTLNNIHAPVD
jgi:sensor histidine kinase YesM